MASLLADDVTCPDIARSWLRSRLAGVRPDTTLHDVPHGEVDGEHPLLLAARPALRDLEGRLRGTGLHVALVDRSGQLVYRWFADASTARRMDEVGVRTGTSFLESAVGTNAMGTALELRRPVTVHGGEHYVDALKPFSCYGHPIFHPLTRRLEGVLDVSAPAGRASPRLGAVAVGTVEGIEERLLLGTRSAQRQLFDAFEVTSRRTSGPLLAVSDDTVIGNRAAWDLVAPEDLAELRDLAARTTSTDTQAVVRLSAGRALDVRLQPVDGGGVGALLHICPTSPSAGQRRQPQPGGARTGTAHLEAERVLVCGPSGSGRSTVARSLLREAPVTELDATTAVVRGSRAWARALVRAWQRSSGWVCVEDIDVLPDELLRVLLDALGRPSGTALALTAAPRSALTGPAAALASRCRCIELAPLTARVAELPALARRALSEVSPGASLRLTPSVLQALRSQPWPGNLHELRTVMAHVAARRSVGDVILTDLPPQYRTFAPQKRLGSLEQAERDAICRELAEHSGNKSRAAQALGISRTTLYARMRSLRVTS